MSLLCGLGLAFLTAASTAPRPFPALPVETLSGRKLDVARDIAPGFAVLIIGFTKASRAQTTQWSRRLEPKLLESTGAQVYQVAVLEDVPRLFRGLVVGRIRASVPGSMHSRFLLALAGAQTWKRLADFGDEDAAYLIVVRDGGVQWRNAGEFSEPGYRRLAQTLRALAGAARFDAGRLATGRFVYRIRKENAEVARFTLTIQKQPDGNFRFTGEATGFDQRWESVATRSFEPISASLQMRRSNGETFSMRLTYGDGRVKGASTTAGAGRSAPEERVIDEAVAAGTVDQRIDWAAALSVALENGTAFRFTVYDPATGVSPVVGSVGPAERIEVPAGTYDATRVVYEIEKANGTESYEVLASRSAPRMMVREDFPQGTVTELLETSDPTPVAR